MKKPGFNLVRTVLYASVVPAVLLQSAAGYTPSKELPTIYEPFDKNPTGDVLPGSSTGTTPALGYGIIGNYVNLGSWESGAVKIVDGGLAFGGLSSGVGKSLQINGASAARGISMTAMMGKATGDTDFFYYDKLYCSYLVRYVDVGSATSGRGELRVVNTGSTSINTFAIHSDSTPTSGAATSTVQPSVSYQSGTGGGYAYAPSPGTQVLADPTANTYLMIGRFTNAGNQLSVQPTGTWTADSPTITVSSATNLAIGQLVTDRDNPASLADNTRVTGISGTTIYLSKNSLLSRTSTNLDFNFVAYQTYLARTATWTNGASTISVSNAAGLQVNMVVTASTGIQVGTTITAITATTLTLSKPTNAAAATPVTLGLRSTTPPLVSGVGSTVTLDRMPVEPIGGNGIPRIFPGVMLRETPGKIGAGTYVTKVSETTLTLSKPLLAGLSNESVNFIQRVGRSTLYALSEAQFNNFTSPSTGMIDADLDAAMIGSAANQVSVRIEGPPQTIGSWEFMPGRRIDLVASGQTIKFDELRYGFTLQAVTQPAIPPALTPNLVQDNFSNGSDSYTSPFDAGSGWKTGYYQVEETAPTKGANVIWSGSNEILPGSGSGAMVMLRQEVGSDQGTSRRPDPAVVNMAQPYTVEFDYVPFLSGQLQFQSFGDRVQIGANGPSGTGVDVTPNPSESANVTWLVGSVGGDDGTNRVFPGKRNWYFFDYDNSSSTIVNGAANFFVSDFMVDTGIVIDGETFRFKIEVDAPNFVYHATITKLKKNDGTLMGTFSKRNLRFRTRSVAHSIFWGASKPAGDPRTFMMDNIKLYPGIESSDQYVSWVAGYPGIPVGKDGRDEDGDSDGKKNFLEFALNGKPNSGTDGPLVIRGYTRVNDGTVAAPSFNFYHTLAIPVRRGTVFTTTPGSSITSNTVDGLSYKIQGSVDLNNWEQSITPVIIDSITVRPSMPTGLDANWTYKMFRLTTPDPQKGFLRAVVTSQ